MANKRERLFGDFPPVSKEQWLEKVTVDLKGASFDKRLVWRTPEGFNLQPMYRREDIAQYASRLALPGEYPYVRSTKLNNEWLVRQDIKVKDPAEANAKALDILNKGVTSLGFHIAKETLSAETLETLFKGIDLTAVEINLSTCVSCTVKLAELFVAYVQQHQIDGAAVRGAIEYNPFKRELMKGVVDDKRYDTLEQLYNIAKPIPQMRLYIVEASMLSNAGAGIVKELAYALAWGAEVLDQMVARGHDVEEIARRIKFHFGISSSYFMEMAKFRAARWLWAEIIGAHGDQYKGDAAKICQHATTSQWNMTIYDAYVNLLRSQTETMSAALGGVDSITVLPFNIAYEESTDFSERIARNQQLLLSEESHFDKVVDPAAGSYYIETLTNVIAEQAWQLFGEISASEGGFESFVTTGALQRDLQETNTERHTAVAKRKETLLGTNEFPNFTETAHEKLATPAVITTGCGCSAGEKQQEGLQPLNFDRGANQFEELRLTTERGKQPVVFMLTIGNLAMRLARSQFSGNFFGCAGYKLVDNLGFETVQEGIDAAVAAKADIVVLCSSDDEYETYAPEAYRLLDGRAQFVVAGNPACTEQLQALGIEHFIHVRSNVLETLQHFNELFGLA